MNQAIKGYKESDSETMQSVYRNRQILGKEGNAGAGHADGGHDRGTSICLRRGDNTFAAAMVKGDTLMIMTEVQGTWTVNIIIRALEYLEKGK